LAAWKAKGYPLEQYQQPLHLDTATKLRAASRRLRKEMSRMNSHVRCARRVLLGLLCASFLLAPAASLGAELKEETLNAWDVYIQKANLEMGDRLHGPFFWVEEAPDRMQRVRAGDILVWSVG
jgi:hypothetical protein